MPDANKQQIRKALEIMENNPGMFWDGSFGFYSNGGVVIRVTWIDDPKKEEFRIGLDINGNIT